MAGAARLLVAVMAVVLVGGCWGWGFSAAPQAPQFAVVPANNYKAGRGEHWRNDLQCCAGVQAAARALACRRAPA